jgi:hypothetical protein
MAIGAQLLIMLAFREALAQHAPRLHTTYRPAHCMVLYARGQMRRGGQQTGVEHQQPSTISDAVRSFEK